MFQFLNNIMMTTTTSHAIMAPVIRPIQESPVSRPRAVYSIDQILGNQTKRSGKNNTLNQIKVLSIKWNFVYSYIRIYY